MKSAFTRIGLINYEGPKSKNQLLFKVGFKELEAYMLKKGEADANASGRQEFLENLINEFI
jgi:xylose isomerase